MTLAPNDWPFGEATSLAPADHLATLGEVFAVFDGRTQDSGNVSFGLEALGRRWFVKTAGDPDDARHFLSHPQRMELLENAQRVARSVTHACLPALEGVTESAAGPMLFYAWVAGELLHEPSRSRADPASAHQRFRRLPAAELTAALDAVVDVHVHLCAAGWVACDFYDGSLIYDFTRRKIWVIDLDSYRRGPFTNQMGRMFGSTRFMAPEEFELGGRIDERTTVFTLGRTIAVFAGDGGLERTGFRGTDAQYRAMTRACDPDPAGRFPTVAELARAWRGPPTLP